MKKLVVKNFLVIKDAKFDMGRINIIIGPQANGKSILVKLSYYFKEIISDILLKSIEKGKSKQELLKDCIALFEKYFPKYTWKDTAFEIQYLYDDINIKIVKTLRQRTLNLKFCKKTSKMYTSLKRSYSSYSKNYKKSEKDIFDSRFYEFKSEYFNKHEEFKKYFNQSLFIPASRSFLANLQKNIFSFLAQNITIDPFMKAFGSNYESIKSLYSEDIFHQLSYEDKNDDYIKTYEKTKKILEQIIRGSYIQEDEQDWIKLKKRSINLSNASSGQQESLPMLLILSTYPFLGFGREKTFFIEEPEAHLFPVSQKHIITLIGILYNINQNIFITTHSPYILSALNNLLQAYDVKEQIGFETIKSLVDPKSTINYDDVKAYTMKDGKLISIMDNETRLIGVNIIDEVSDEFSNVFDKLLELQNSHD